MDMWFLRRKGEPDFFNITFIVEVTEKTISSFLQINKLSIH